MADSQPPEYAVEMTGFARAQLRAIGRRALYAGGGGEVVAAFRQIPDRLRSDPRTCGEPMYHLRRMRVEVRKVAVRPLYVESGVHDQRPVVIIRHVAALDDPAAAP
jgi:hypothetical protein